MCYQIDSDKALLITERTHPELANLNCQELAVSADAKAQQRYPV